MPPLDVGETEVFLKQVCPVLLETDAPRLILEATGGSPWLTKVVLSFFPLAAGVPERSGYDRTNLTQLVGQCIQLAETAMASGGKAIRGALGTEIRRKVETAETVLGKAQIDDVGIVKKWREPVAERRLYRIVSPRFENFVAAGLVWLEGNPWVRDTEESVFFEYPPTVRLCRASRLALAAYDFLTDAKPL